MANQRKPPAKRAAKKTTARKPPTDAPGIALVEELPRDDREPSLLTVLNDAVEKMDWLADTDEAMVELARDYCRRIDLTKALAVEWDAIAGPLREMAEITESKSLIARLVAVEKQLDVTRQIGWLGPHLANTLRDLGGAPAERKGLKADGPVENRLAAIRSQASRRQSPRSR